MSRGLWGEGRGKEGKIEQVKQIPHEPNQEPSSRWDEWIYLMAFFTVVLSG
jgi:hypothetical protein